ncbi:MAG: TonB-dependent receptor [Bryobacteraceae bacterium]
METAPTGTVETGPISQPENDFSLSSAYNYILAPTLVNEFRAGYTGSNSSTNFGLSAANIQNELGLGLPGVPPPGAAVPAFAITGFQTTASTYSQYARTSTRQMLDNITWTRGKHTVKIGGDYRYLTGYYNANFAATRMGIFTFNNSVTASAIGNPFGAFLLGIPDSTSVATVTATDANAKAQHYAVFVQDDWKVNSRFTLNYGLRYEYHPMFNDTDYNTATWLPNNNAVVNGVTVHGAVLIPDKRANGLDQDLVQSVAPTPFITASQAGYPQTLRNSDKTDFAPRVGFAYPPFGNSKTVIRGGYGKFIETLLGNALFSQWGIPTSYNGAFTNSIVNGKPTLSFPYAFPSSLAAAPGTAQFLACIDVNYRDPYVQQWNFTLERDLGFNTGLRLSYDGSHGTDLGYYIDGNQVAPNTVGYATVKPSRPYPAWSYIKLNVNGARSNYDAFTAAVNKRFSKGLQFQTSYVFAKNLSNEPGYNQTAFTGENGGQVQDRFDPNLDYGNVEFTRRQRLLSTFIYNLPIGHGRALLGNANRAVDSLLGGWELAGVLLFQTGPYIAVAVPGADPSGTNFVNIIGAGRADIISGAPLYPTNQTPGQWINSAAFAIAPNNIGRYGDSPVGAVEGPGTQAISVSLFKTFQFTEHVRMQLEGAASNLFNHLNLGLPNTSLGTAAFGTITSTQTAEGAAPRSIQLTGRITF